MTNRFQPGRILHLYQGRCGRGQYWLLIAVLVVLYLVLTPLLAVWAGLVTLPLWILASGRRLHDLGRSAWWSIVPFAMGFIKGFLGGVGVVFPFTDAQWSAVLGLVSLGLMVLLGSWPGDKAANRFGPPPGRTKLKRDEG